MILKVKDQSGQKPTAALADNGYLSEENLRGAAKMRVETYLAVSKQKHSQIVPPCPRGPIPKGARLLERMRRKLQTVAGRAIRRCHCIMLSSDFRRKAGLGNLPPMAFKVSCSGILSVDLQTRFPQVKVVQND